MPIKYVPFVPEPVEGQAVLGNFNRVLKYKGADDVTAVLQRGMPLYEVEKQETVGEDPDGSMVIRGECVSACAYLKERGIQVDLVYIDPPFASGADYAKKIYVRRDPKVAAAIAQAEQELDDDELKTFEEKMYGDVWDKEKYLNWMYERNSVHFCASRLAHRALCKGIAGRDLWRGPVYQRDRVVLPGQLSGKCKGVCHKSQYDILVFHGGDLCFPPCHDPVGQNRKAGQARMVLRPQ